MGGHDGVRCWHDWFHVGFGHAVQPDCRFQDRPQHGQSDRDPPVSVHLRRTYPVSIVVKRGGRFVNVVNQGTPAAGTKPAVAGNIAAFSVGNDGVLTFQQSYSSQASTPVWAVSDSAGSFLYVLDQVAPDGSGNGSMTVFGITRPPAACN